MHKLARGAEPAVLARLRRSANTLKWADLNAQDKAEIWQALHDMQYTRCAYCERNLAGHGGRHIEHFRPQREWQEGIFAWANLFGSCDCQQTCGKHKDQRAHDWNWQHLIKPDQDDPDDFLRCYASGEIHPKTALDKQAELRASETIRVFNLNHGPLQAQRQQAATGWLAHLVTILEENAQLHALGELSAEQVDQANYAELQHLLDHTEALPHSTAIRHTLTDWLGENLWLGDNPWAGEPKPEQSTIIKDRQVTDETRPPLFGRDKLLAE